jgi:hypothetical protein
MVRACSDDGSRGHVTRELPALKPVKGSLRLNRLCTRHTCNSRIFVFDTRFFQSSVLSVRELKGKNHDSKDWLGVPDTYAYTLFLAASSLAIKPIILRYFLFAR